MKINNSKNYTALKADFVCRSLCVKFSFGLQRCMFCALQPALLMPTCVMYRLLFGLVESSQFEHFIVYQLTIGDIRSGQIKNNRN